MSMDATYYPKSSQPIIHLEQFHHDYQTAIAGQQHLQSATAQLRDVLGYTTTDTEFAALEASVSLDQLGDAHDLRICPYVPGETRPHALSSLDAPAKAVATLRTLSALAAHQSFYSRPHLNRMVKSEQRHWYAPPETVDERANRSNRADLMAAHSEMLVCIRVYEPKMYIPNRRRHPQLQQSIIMLGSQTLADFRDRIRCKCSQSGPFVDISKTYQPADATDVDKRAPGKTKKPSKTSTATTIAPDPGIFFITDTFYVDYRHAGSAAYVTPVREWQRRHATEIGPMSERTPDMQMTRMADLRLRLGAPHVYQHYGNCEHVFSVTDVRLLGACDPMLRRRYPLVNTVRSVMRKVCVTCGSEAAILVCDSDRHIKDPAHLCEECFGAFHYVDGERLGEFRAYRYGNDEE